MSITEISEGRIIDVDLVQKSLLWMPEPGWLASEKLVVFCMSSTSGLPHTRTIKLHALLIPAVHHCTCDK